MGKSNHRYVFGLQEQPPPVIQSTSHNGPSYSDLVLMLESERMKNRDLEAKLKQKEDRVHELEMTTFSAAGLGHQLDRVTNPHFQIYHGPDSIEHFDNFSVEHMISEVKQHAPDVLRLLSLLGRSPSLTDEPGVNDMRTVAALCSLVKGRSEKVLGIQLLVSFMLIARSTNRQVLQCCSTV